MTIKLYNTMSRKIEEFKPLVPGQVSFYSCGPTVYSYQHLGNMRAFVDNDILKRMFIENGYDVRHVMNITDVGHLTNDDDDSGEDKMEKGAKRENKSVWDIATMYTNAFLRDTKSLNTIPPTFMPKATDYIKEQIEQVQKLEELGYTYTIPNDGIYYDTSKFADYGALGGQNIDELRSGARIENTDKKNPTDFALWKFSPKNEKRAMEWDSPWGIGFPGWHIECSAMSMKLLGPHFDVHTGGQEHAKVHHSDEIAQSEPIVGKPWVNYWLHWAWLLSKDGKMSKSAGDTLTVEALINKGYDPMAYRYMLLLGHYKQPMEFSFEALDSAVISYKNITRKISDLLKDENKAKTDADVYEIWHKKMLDTMSDNLKTAEVIVQIQELLKDTNIISGVKIAILKFVDNLLGLQFIDRAQKLLDSETVDVPDNIQKIADDRIKAKAEKNWALADELRNKIENSGWQVLDTKNGAKIIKKMS